MTLADWIVIGAAAVLGPLIGSIVSRVIRSALGASHRPEALQKAAKPISSLAFWLGVVVALIVILGVLRPSVVDNLADDFVEFIPKALVAAIILIGANVLSTFAVTALSTATARMPLDIQQKANLVVRAVIVTFAALLAVSQIGIDTEVVNMAVAAVLFGIAASLVLLVGLGGNPVAKQVASARSLRRIIDVGDQLSAQGVSGTVEAVGPTHVAIAAADGVQRIPASEIMSGPYTLTKTNPEA